MLSKARNISVSQLVMLLFTSRFFSYMTYIPRAQQSLTGSAALLAIPLAAAGAAVAILPFLLLCRVCGPDPLTAALRGNRVFGSLFTALFGLYCLYLAAASASHFEFFMTSTIYQNAAPWTFIIFLTIAAAYGAKLGLEAFSRMGLLGFVMTMLALVVLALTLGKEVDLARVSSPLYDGWQQVLSGALMMLCGNTEYLPFFLLLFRTGHKRGGKSYAWLIAGVTLAAELLAFLMLTTLGDYAQTRLFPLHAAATLAQVSVFGRLDLLHIVTWVLVAFLRSTLYLYCAVTCLRRIFHRLSIGAGTVICAVAAALFSVATTTQTAYWRMWGSLWHFAGPFLLFMVAFPLLTLLFPKARIHSIKKGATPS